jgi:DNA-binding transcriptional regulator YdaS (Cro superfamily)
MDTHETPIRYLIRIVGGPTAAARIFGVTRQTVRNWTRGGPFPAELAPSAERIAREHGGRVFAEELCPLVEWFVIRGRRQPVRARFRRSEAGDA